MHIKRIDLSESQLVFELFDKYRMFYKQPSDIKRAEEFINARLENSESVIFVAIDENNLAVGFTQLYPTYSSVKTLKNWILNDLYVETAFRKKGVARELIDAALNFAKANDANYIQLETGTDNFSAQKLYESIDFIRQNTSSSEFYLYKKEIK